jgi:hypothetical protein
MGRIDKNTGRKYDYRYSQLPLVFARLVQEGRISCEDLAENELGYVRFVQESSARAQS